MEAETEKDTDVETVIFNIYKVTSTVSYVR